MKTESCLILFLLTLLLSCENAIVSQEENIDFKDSGTRFYNTKEINQEHKVCSVYSEIALKNYANTVNTPVLSVPAGDFWNTITVFVTCDTTGDVSIYYTTDGSEPIEPTSESISYTVNGIKIDKTATLKVVAYKDGLKCSETVTAEYTKRTAQTYNENTSGVMLQGFNWDSAANDGGYTLENKSPKWGKWYNVMLKN
ncbi:MAG: FN3 associated domain-containing protein, partial [Spirochaetota bacterium]|nr:FN3 associated domain-containing protein [Spirochaetota bacterium]